MPRKSKAKPKTPSDIAAEKLADRKRDFFALNLPEASAGLATFKDVQVSHAQKEKIDNARRSDAFDALKADMAQKNPGAYDAARKLEHDMLVRAGMADRGRLMVRVDETEDPLAFMRRKLDAGERVDAVLGRVGLRDKWLLTELIERTARTHIFRDKDGAPTGQLEGWRANVAYITGEVNPVAQGAAVRAACSNLAEGYRLIEGEKRALAA